ncbi:uncharacterized protein LOC144743393 [Ciona intestinalis]
MDIRNKWRNIRDTYVKKKKGVKDAMKSGAGSDAVLKLQNWKWFSLLSWLDDSLRHEATESNFIVATFDPKDIGCEEGVQRLDSDTYELNLTSVSESVNLNDSCQSTSNKTVGLCTTESEVEPILSPKRRYWRKRFSPKKKRRTDTSLQVC